MTAVKTTSRRAGTPRAARTASPAPKDDVGNGGSSGRSGSGGTAFVDGEAGGPMVVLCADGKACVPMGHRVALPHADDSLLINWYFYAK